MATLQTTPLISIVTINYHSEEYLYKLISKLGKSKDIEVVVVDNDVSSPLPDSLIKKNPHITYVPAGSNTGFSGGNNIGLHHAKGEWVLFLNSDTEVTGQEVLTLVDTVKESGQRAGAPKLVYDNGNAQKSVGFFDSIMKNPINYLFARPRWSELTDTQTVDVATAAALLLHSSLFKTIGIWDEHFFMYYEDIDYCMRMKNAGIQILYVPTVTMLHHEGMSADKNKEQKNVNYTNGLRTYLMKHRGPLVYWLNTIFHFLK